MDHLRNCILVVGIHNARQKFIVGSRGTVLDQRGSCIPKVTGISQNPQLRINCEIEKLHTISTPPKP